MKAFFDTNVLVYLFDTGSPAKQRLARELIEAHTRLGETLLSTQILQEFYVVATRKLSVPMPEEHAFEVVREFAVMPTVRVDIPLILAAIQLSQTRKLSFWDALIIRAAIEGGAGVLYSEDLSHGESFETVTVNNPFR